MKALPFLGVLLLLASGCANIHELRPGGDTMRLEFEKKQFTCELLALSDSVMYFIPLAEKHPELPLATGKIYAAPPYAFVSGDVLGYANRDWDYPILGLQVLPILLIAAQAAVYYDDFEIFPAWIATLGVIPLVNMLILHLGTSEIPHFDEMLIPPKTSEFRKYARYPKGLTPEQLQLLLAVRNQSEPLSLPSSTPTRMYHIDAQ